MLANINMFLQHITTIITCLHLLASEKDGVWKVEVVSARGCQADLLTCESHQAVMKFSTVYSGPSLTCKLCRAAAKSWTGGSDLQHSIA